MRLEQPMRVSGPGIAPLSDVIFSAFPGCGASAERRPEITHVMPHGQAVSESHVSVR